MGRESAIIIIIENNAEAFTLYAQGLKFERVQKVVEIIEKLDQVQFA